MQNLVLHRIGAKAIIVLSHTAFALGVRLTAHLTPCFALRLAYKGKNEKCG
ncbi:hypothetical protein [Helicobacter muridarum]|uniref:hypothetical protein n=1 Tax=Helicobacter muridarum TaxID=216 RepID=UPI001386B1A3|nr:hypothetical protein [Helicobacter muridarum]